MKVQKAYIFEILNDKNCGVQVARTNTSTQRHIFSKKKDRIVFDQPAMGASLTREHTYCSIHAFVCT